MCSLILELEAAESDARPLEMHIVRSDAVDELKRAVPKRDMQVSGAMVVKDTALSLSASLCSQ